MTDPSRPDRIRALFDEVVGLNAEERSARLAEACAGDPELRREVESLLEAAEARGSAVESALEGMWPVDAAEAEASGAPTSEVHPALQSALSDRYTFLRELGRGGMATVYLAEDRKHRRKVAVKVLNPELSKALGIGRFLREIETAANLTHPHILPLFDSGEAAGMLFYVMPYVDGESLRGRLNREGQLPLEDAVRITREIADALAYAHDQGVIHRDVKPANILLEAGHAVLADFGVAQAVAGADESRLTATGVSLGTPSYMSPEQAAGDRTMDGRSDQYALGCVLYEMLAGQPPFVGRHTESVVRQHMVSDPRPIAEVRATVPESVEAALRKALAKAPADRFGSIGEFGQVLEGELPAPVRRIPLAAPDRMRRFGWVAGGAAGAAVVAALLMQPPWGNGAEAIPSTPEDILATAIDEWGPAVAVLPFESLGVDEEDSYLAAGIEAEITRLLGLIHGLVLKGVDPMIQRSRPRTVRQLADELQARYVISGSVQEAGGQLRIHVRLIDALTGRYLWQQHYDRTPQGDLFELQSDVAKAIASELEIRISSREQGRLQASPTRSAAAYDLYLRSKGLDPQEEAQNGAAIELLRQAIQYDSLFALAFEEMAWRRFFARIIHGQSQPQLEFDPARRAVELDPESAGAHAILGLTLGYFGGPSLRRAVEISPNNAAAWAGLGAFGWWTGDHVGGALAARRAIHLARDHGNAAYNLAQCLGLVGMHEEAREWMERALEVDPENPWAKTGLAYRALSAGDLDRAQILGNEMLLEGENVGRLYVAGFIDLVSREVEVARGKLNAVARTNPGYSVNGLPTAQFLHAWAVAVTGLPGGHERLESLKAERLEFLEETLAHPDVVRAKAPDAIPPNLAQRLATLYNDLAVASSVLGNAEEEVRWFLKAAQLDRMHTFYGWLRSAPWLDRIQDDPGVRRWRQAKEEHMASQRAELAAMGPWAPEDVLRSPPGILRNP